MVTESKEPPNQLNSGENDSQFKFFNIIEDTISGIFNFFGRFLKTTWTIARHPGRVTNLEGQGIVYARPLTYLVFACFAACVAFRITYQTFSYIWMINGDEEKKTAFELLASELGNISLLQIAKFTFPVMIAVYLMGKSLDYLSKKKIIAKSDDTYLNIVCYTTGFQFTLITFWVAANILYQSLGFWSGALEIILGGFSWFFAGWILLSWPIIVWQTDLIKKSNNDYRRWGIWAPVLTTCSVFLISMGISSVAVSMAVDSDEKSANFATKIIVPSVSVGDDNRLYFPAVVTNTGKKPLIVISNDVGWIKQRPGFFMDESDKSAISHRYQVQLESSIDHPSRIVIIEPQDSHLLRLVTKTHKTEGNKQWKSERWDFDFNLSHSGLTESILFAPRSADPIEIPIPKVDETANSLQ